MHGHADMLANIPVNHVIASFNNIPCAFDIVVDGFIEVMTGIADALVKSEITASIMTTLVE